MIQIIHPCAHSMQLKVPLAYFNLWFVDTVSAYLVCFSVFIANVSVSITFERLYFRFYTISISKITVFSVSVSVNVGSVISVSVIVSVTEISLLCISSCSEIHHNMMDFTAAADAQQWNFGSCSCSILQVLFVICYCRLCYPWRWYGLCTDTGEQWLLVVECTNWWTFQLRRQLLPCTECWLPYRWRKCTTNQHLNCCLYN